MTSRAAEHDDQTTTATSTAHAPSARWSVVAGLIAEHLTPRQREVVELVCLRGLDQPTVARLLGISQQSVSEHLHGRMRRGVRVGGALRKLRRLCGAGDDR